MTVLYIDWYRIKAVLDQIEKDQILESDSVVLFAFYPLSKRVLELFDSSSSNSGGDSSSSSSSSYNYIRQQLLEVEKRTFYSTALQLYAQTLANTTSNKSSGNSNGGGKKGKEKKQKTDKQVDSSNPSSSSSGGNAQATVSWDESIERPVLPSSIDWSSEGIISSLKIIFDAAIITAFPQCKIF